MEIVAFLVAFLATAVALAVALAPLVMSIVEMVKLTVKALAPPGVPGELVPGLACLLGVGLALAVFGYRPETDIRAILLGGFAAGLIGSRLFDAGQARTGPGPPREPS